MSTTGLGTSRWDSGFAVAAAVTVIWLASAAAALLSPELVSGSAHERLPLVALTIWVWTAVSTAYVVMTRPALDGISPRSRRSFAAAVSIIWVVCCVACVASPVFVTGTDPTRIPLASLLAPAFAMVATGFVCLSVAVRASRRTSVPAPSG